MSDIKVKGLDELYDALKKNATLQDVQRVVKHNGAGLQQKMQRKADFKQGYQTGATKDSIGLEIIDNGLTAVCGPTTEYAEYLEYGTRFMNAQPFVQPALNEQAKKFQKDLQKLMK